MNSPDSIRSALQLSVTRLIAGVLAMLGATLAVAAEPTTLPAMPAEHPPFGKAAAERPRLAPDTVLARIDGATITAADLDAAINALAASDRYEYTAPDAVRDLVEGLIDRRLLARAARAAGADRQSTSGEQSAGASEAELAEAFLARELDRLPAPTEAQIARYYREHDDEYTVPARVRVTRVVTSSGEAAARLREDLARGTTADELRSRGGGAITSVETLWLQDTPRKSEIVAVALGLKKGEVSGVVTVAAGFAVLRAEETAAARLRPLDDVRAGIAATLAAAGRLKAAEDLRTRLRSAAKITVLEQPLMSYLPPLPGAVPGPLR